MKTLLLPLALALGLTACSSTTPPPVAQNLLNAAVVGCQVDGQFVPLAQGVVSAAVPLVVAANAPAGAAVVTASAVDATLVHPAVVAACKALDAAAAPASKPAGS